MVRIAVVALDGVFASSLAVTLDVIATVNRLQLARSGSKRPKLVAHVVNPQGRSVRTSSGHRHSVDGAWDAVLRPEVVLVPGLFLPALGEVEAALVRPDVVATTKWVARQHGRGAIVGASCSATFLLAQAGLLDGGSATTTWWLAPAFRARYPKVDLQANMMVTQANRIFCAGAAFAQVDLMLAIVAHLMGPKLADLCAQYLILDHRPTQTRYLVLSHLARSNSETTRAESWIVGNLGRRFTVADVARALGTSTRTLARRIQLATGMSPLAFVQKIRTDHAIHLLQTTALSVEAIAARVGYEDATALRRIIKRDTQRSPRELRRAP